MEICYSRTQPAQIHRNAPEHDGPEKVESCEWKSQVRLSLMLQTEKSVPYRRPKSLLEGKESDADRYVVGLYARRSVVEGLRDQGQDDCRPRIVLKFVSHHRCEWWRRREKVLHRMRRREKL